MNKAIQCSFVLLAPVLLGGCGVLHKLGIGRPQPTRQAATAPQAQPAGAAIHTAAGRRHLDEGNFGLAIAAFQQALGNQEPSGPALNGLAVAYARLGRSDAAEKLFHMALNADPDNASYAANLAMLSKSRSAPVPAPAAMQAHAPATAQTASPAADVAPAPAALAATEVPAGRLVRTAPRQFTIRTVRAGEGPARSPAIAARFRPVIRMALRPPVAAQPSEAKSGGNRARVGASR